MSTITKPWRPQKKKKKRGSNLFSSTNAIQEGGGGDYRFDLKSAYKGGVTFTGPKKTAGRGTTYGTYLRGGKIKKIN